MLVIGDAILDAGEPYPVACGINPPGEKPVCCGIIGLLLGCRPPGRVGTKPKLPVVIGTSGLSIGWLLATGARGPLGPYEGC